MKKDRIINMLYSYSVISGVIGGLFVLGCIFFVLNTSLFNPIRLAVIVDLVMIGCVCYYALYTFFKVIKNIKEENDLTI